MTFEAATVRRPHPRWSQSLTVVVFRRPGCGFCASLLRQLDRAGLTYERVDIWEDEEGAAYVRSVAGGNETVPTVRVGDRAFVNPAAVEILRLVAEEAPELLPGGYEPPQPGRLARALGRLLGG
jgi:mycoredoxin